MTSSSFTELLGLIFITAWIMLQMSWFVVIPIMAASFYYGIRGGTRTAWILIALFIAGCILIPLTGEGGSGAIVYMALPFVVPLYILSAYGVGQLLSRFKRKEHEKDGFESFN